MEHKFHKNNRLENHDYSKDGIYFLTICTEKREMLLSRIVARGILDAPTAELTHCGEAVKNAIEFLHKNRENISVLHYTIMPNHVHLLVRVFGASGKPRATSAEKDANVASGKMCAANAEVPSFVSGLKRHTNRICGRQLWQKSYYDHVIRDESDYLTKAEYIENNAAKWVQDEYYMTEELR